jgi:sec-independent protein translocase protein TatC
MGNMNHISHEFTVLKRTITRYALVLFSVFAGLLVLPPGAPSFATRLFLSVKESLIPEGIPVVALGPVSPFVAPIMIAFLVALLATFPFLIYSIIRFLRPALQRGERKALSRYILPSLVLFYAGCSLAYFVVIPATFSILYSFAAPLGVAPLFALDDFISSVFFLTISVGLAFLLPVCMAASSRIGIIPPGFWLRHWRGAIVSSVLFSAVVTPDGSGVTMALLFAPLVALYGIGAIVSGRNGQK